MIKTICSHCSVIKRSLKFNGVWVRQEVAQDHSISHGEYCYEGAGYD
ncbi:MAG: hypothetical protein R2837_04930 [Aliarcobacter sp.]